MEDRSNTLGKLHVLICSFLYDVGAEGICTARLVRGLVGAGCKVTLVTSSFSRPPCSNTQLRTVVVPSGNGITERAWNRLARATQYALVPWHRWPGKVARIDLGERPSVVYARCQPIWSLVAGQRLARRLGVPLCVHLSDPIPSPWDVLINAGENAIVRLLRSILEEAALVTFTTAAAIDFQERTTGVRLRSKAIVLNHIAPEPVFLPDHRPSDRLRFIYTGTFYEHRTHDVLLKGFAHHLQSHPDSELWFVGPDPNPIMRDAHRLCIESRVIALPRSTDVRGMLAKAHVTVAVDSAVGQPVFLPTKMVENLVVNRPLLVLTQAGSPSFKLATRFPETVVWAETDKPGSVAAGMSTLAAMSIDEKLYTGRFCAMKDFKQETVIQQFLQNLAERGLICR